jgi:hypothetical protein
MVNAASTPTLNMVIVPIGVEQHDHPDKVSENAATFHTLSVERGSCRSEP